MVTFFRKSQLNGNSSNKDSAVELPHNLQSGRFNGSDYVGVISPEDELPYVVVRPKINRKNNGKKVLRMRSAWD